MGADTLFLESPVVGASRPWGFVLFLPINMRPDDRQQATVK